MQKHIEGRVVNRRPLSRRLVFLELERDQEQDLELLLKGSSDPDGLSESQVHSLRDIVKVGDIVSVSGTLESNTSTFKVSSLKVIEAWKTGHAGTSFVPKLLPSLHADLLQSEPSGGDTDPHAADISHALSAQKLLSAEPSAQILCKYWVNAGKCLRGDACQFRHVHPSQLPELRKGWVVARRRHKQELSVEAGNPHGFDAAKKGQRAAVFCDWLIATFGSEMLSQGSGVLDVAGGRGDVSFELQTVRGIRCTLIDPRPQKLSKNQRKWLQSFRQQELSASAESLPKSSSQTVTATNGLDLVPDPTTHERAVPTGESTAAVSALTAAAPCEELPSAAIDASDLTAVQSHQQTSAAAWAHTGNPPSSADCVAREDVQATHSGQQGVALGAMQGKLEPECTTAGSSTSPARPPPTAVQMLLATFRVPSDTADPLLATAGFPSTMPEPAALEPPNETSHSAVEPEAGQAHASETGPQGLQGTLSHQIQAEFNSNSWTQGPLARQLQSCSLVLGLHPDQATDSIVEFALHFNKPFAVVPCCVFPRQFQHRQLCDTAGAAQPVSTHAELVSYLQERSAGCREYLPFEGMNQVVFKRVWPR